MKIREVFKLRRSPPISQSVIPILLRTSVWWPPKAWPRIVEKLREYSYRNNQPIIHWRWLAPYPSIGPAGWYVWAQQPDGFPTGAIEVFFYHKTSVMKAQLQFHAERSLRTWPLYSVSYDQIWIDDFMVPPRIPDERNLDRKD